VCNGFLQYWAGAVQHACQLPFQVQHCSVECWLIAKLIILWDSPGQVGQEATLGLVLLLPEEQPPLVLDVRHLAGGNRMLYFHSAPPAHSLLRGSSRRASVPHYSIARSSRLRRMRNGL